MKIEIRKHIYSEIKTYSFMTLIATVLVCAFSGLVIIPMSFLEFLEAWGFIFVLMLPFGVFVIYSDVLEKRKVIKKKYGGSVRCRNNRNHRGNPTSNKKRN